MISQALLIPHGRDYLLRNGWGGRKREEGEGKEYCGWYVKKNKKIKKYEAWTFLMFLLWAGVVALWAKHLLKCRESWAWFPAPYIQGVAMHAFNPSKTGRWKEKGQPWYLVVQGQLGLHEPCLKRKKISPFDHHACSFFYQETVHIK